MKPKLVMVVCAAAVFALTVLAGCGSTAAPPTSPQPATAASQQPASVEPETPATVAPVPDSHSVTWHYKRENGYTCSVKYTVWAPLSSDASGQVAHPADNNDTLASTVDYNPKKDVVIPLRIEIKNTTSGFDLENLQTGVGIFGETLGKSRLKIPEDGQALDYIAFYSDGRSTDQWLISTTTSDMFGPEAPTLAVSGGTPTIITWDTVPPGGTAANNVFLVVHDYYSPSAPNGEKALLAGLAVGPSEFSMADWTPTAKSTALGLTLSGKVAKE